MKVQTICKGPFAKFRGLVSGQDKSPEGKSPQACLLLCLFGLVMILHSVCCCCFAQMSFFAAMNVIWMDECVWGRVMCGERRNSHSLGSSHICSTASPNLSPPLMEKGMFCLWNSALLGLCTPFLSSIRNVETLHDVAAMLAKGALLGSFICLSKGPFLLLFLAKIHQAWQAGQFEPSRRQSSRSLPQSSPPLFRKKLQTACSRPRFCWVMWDHVYKITGEVGLKVQGAPWGRWG